jgi:hypothetical protein
MKDVEIIDDEKKEVKIRKAELMEIKAYKFFSETIKARKPLIGCQGKWFSYNGRCYCEIEDISKMRLFINDL